MDHEPLFSNIIEVIKKSKEIGLKKILTISTNLNSFEKIKKIIEIDAMIYGTIGIHPHESSKDIVKSNYLIDNASKYKKIIGIGETGLDFYYENSKDLQNTFSKIPSEKLLIETDSPFLAPIPMRGKKNEPSFLKYTLEKLSEIKSININELEQITNNNFEKLFS